MLPGVGCGFGGESLGFGSPKLGCCYSGPKDHRNKRILETIISGIPLGLGLRSRMWDPDVLVVLETPLLRNFNNVPIVQKPDDYLT